MSLTKDELRLLNYHLLEPTKQQPERAVCRRIRPIHLSATGRYHRRFFNSTYAQKQSLLTISANSCSSPLCLHA